VPPPKKAATKPASNPLAGRNPVEKPMKGAAPAAPPAAPAAAPEPKAKAKKAKAKTAPAKGSDDDDEVLPELISDGEEGGARARTRGTRRRRNTKPQKRCASFCPPPGFSAAAPVPSDGLHVSCAAR
jgi:hypothetical protein